MTIRRFAFAKIVLLRNRLRGGGRSTTHMLYTLWTIAGLLAMILLVLIVMHRDYNPALSTLHSGLNQLRQNR
jgi:hypothetical protein